MLCLLGVLFFSTSHGRAAEFTVQRQPGEKLVLVQFSGEILRDINKFRVMANRVPMLFTVLVMDSPGGNVAAALEIGREVKARGFSTLVKAGNTCASACGLIWLAGDSRYMARGARIGFHAAYAEHGGAQVEKGAPNALIGSYLHQLELPDTAIAYVTKASPGQMEWLTVLNAMHVGINFKVPGENGD